MNWTPWVILLVVAAVAAGGIALLVAALKLAERTIVDLTVAAAQATEEHQTTWRAANETVARLRATIVQLRGEITILEGDLATCADTEVVRSRLRRLLAGTTESTYQGPLKH